MKLAEYSKKLETTAVNLAFWGAAVGIGAVTLLVIMKAAKKLRDK